MAFQMITFISCFLAVNLVCAGHISLDHHSYAGEDGGHYGHAAYIAAPAVVKTAVPVLKHVDYHSPAKYDFSYGVHDPHTGDVKNQKESREGHVVHGSYSLIDADGYKRTVEYTADEHNGFNAVVHREPLHHKVAIAPAPVAKIAVAPVTKIAYAAAPVHTAHYAPVHTAHYAPVHAAHYAPVHKVVAAAPVLKAAAPVHYSTGFTTHHYAEGDAGYYGGHYDGYHH